MARSISLNGTDAGVDLILDGNVVSTFSRGKAIDALSFYNALDYHAGNTYELHEGSRGPIPKGSFDSLEGLVKEIIEGINGLSTEEACADDSPSTMLQSYAVTDEDIPF